MMRAYSELYIEDARKALAAMLDYAVYSLGYELRFFYSMFLSSAISRKFSYGDAGIIAGKTGAELARIIVEEHSGQECNVPYNSSLEKSPEYWTGWALAYYQWYVGDDFNVINDAISIDDICMLYNKYHEMDISHFVNRLNEIRMQHRCMTYLKKIRQNAGYSQRELAELADIPVKTIQQYEQRQKNINKASFEYIIRISRALGCRPEELMESNILLEKMTT